VRSRLLALRLLALPSADRALPPPLACSFAQMVGRPASQPMPPRAAPLIKPEPDAEPAEPAVPELGWRTWIPFGIDVSTSAQSVDLGPEPLTQLGTERHAV
jgi:hypothetical protein